MKGHINGEDATLTQDQEADFLSSILTTPTQADIERAVQMHIDSTARTKGYDSGVSCASYAVSTDPVFKAESTAFIAWRDSVWRYCHNALADTLEGLRLAPESVDSFIAELPAFIWPEVTNG